MAFNGSEGGPIPLDKAASWTANYRKKNPNSTRAHYFGRQIIEKILAQPGCVGIRMYHGLEENGTQQLVLVGVTPDESDMQNGIIADLSFACPPNCIKDNALNGQ